MPFLAVTLAALALAPNAAPVCEDATFPYQSGIGFPVTCTDADGDALTFEVTEPPAHGTLTEEGGGRFSFSPGYGRFDPVTFRFRAVDTAGNASEPATVTLNRVREAPGCGGTLSTIEVTAGLSAGTGMCWGESGEVVTAPRHGKVTFRTNGETVLPNYEANADAGGRTDTFAFRMVNPDGARSPVYTVAVNIAALAPAPAADPALAPPEVGVRVLSRSRRQALRRGLPLEVGCDVACALTVTIAGTVKEVSAGRVRVPLPPKARRAARRAKRPLVIVTVTGSAPVRGSAVHAVAVRLR